MLRGHTPDHLDFVEPHCILVYLLLWLLASFVWFSPANSVFDWSVSHNKWYQSSKKRLGIGGVDRLEARCKGFVGYKDQIHTIGNSLQGFCEGKVWIFFSFGSILQLFSDCLQWYLRGYGYARWKSYKEGIIHPKRRVVLLWRLFKVWTSIRPKLMW